MAVRDIEIAGVASARFRVPAGSWISVPLSGMARTYSVTDDAPGRDVAFIEIDNVDNTPIFFVCYDAITQGTGDPEALIADFTSPAPQNGTQGLGIKVAGNAVYTMDKVRNLTHVSFFCTAAHHGVVQFSVHSYRTAVEAPWT